MLLGGREEVLLAVDGPAGGGEEDLAHAAVAGRLGQVQAAEDVDVGVEDRVLDRAPDVHLRGVVDQDVDPRARAPGPPPPSSGCPARGAPRPAGTFSRLPPDRLSITSTRSPLGEEGLGQMGADEAGSAR